MLVRSSAVYFLLLCSCLKAALSPKHNYVELTVSVCKESCDGCIMMTPPKLFFLFFLSKGWRHFGTENAQQCNVAVTRVWICSVSLFFSQTTAVIQLWNIRPPIQFPAPVHPTCTPAPGPWWAQPYYKCSTLSRGHLFRADKPRFHTGATLNVEGVEFHIPLPPAWLDSRRHIPLFQVSRTLNSTQTVVILPNMKNELKWKEKLNNFMVMYKMENPWNW